jgi:hypothetical protein
VVGQVILEFVMYEARRLDAVASRLQSYQDQLAALSTALDSLRDLTDALVREMADDSAAIGAIATAAQAAALSRDDAGGYDPVITPAIVSAAVAADTYIDATPPDPTVPDEPPLAFTTEAALDQLAGTRVALADADRPSHAADRVAATSTTAARDKALDTATQDPPLAPIVIATEPQSGGSPATQPAARPRVVDFASRVQSAKSTPFRRTAAGAVASALLIISATAGVHGFLQSDIGQRLLELGTCDAEVVTDGRQCNVFGWMLL